MPEAKWRAVAIDDQEDILRLYDFMLQGSRIDLIGKATTGEEGLRMVKETAPDLVILDLSMPGMDGLEVLQEIRRNGRRPRVAVVSGLDRDRVSRDAQRLGADLYVEKGLAPLELVRQLESLANRPDPTEELI